SLALASLNRTCRDHRPDVSAALTTLAFDQSGPRWLGISDLIAEPEGPTFISYKVARSRLDRLRFVTQDPKRTLHPQPHYKMLGYPSHRRSPWRGHMRRREFIAGTAATALAGFAQPTCAQTSARPGVRRLAIFHPTDRPEEITSNANRVYKAYFDELK